MTELTDDHQAGPHAGRHRARGLSRHRNRGGHQGIRRARPGAGVQRGTRPRRRGRVHPQQGQGRAGVVVAAGADHRAAARGDPQFRRRQRLHRPAGVPGHPRHRRGRRRRAVGLGHRNRGHRGRGLLDRADRRPAADGQGAGRRHRDRARDGRRADRRRGGRPRHHDHRHRAQTGCAAPQRQLDGRRHGQGCGHAGAVAGHHAQRHHHRRRRRRRRPGPCAAERDRADLRPPRRRRQLLDQRHRAAAGLRRQ